MTDHDLSKRYGNLKNGSDDIKNHRFFNEINFYSVITMAMKPLYTPGENLQKRRDWMKQPGSHYKLIEENRDDVNSPPIVPHEDPFKQWF